MGFELCGLWLLSCCWCGCLLWCGFCVLLGLGVLLICILGITSVVAGVKWVLLRVSLCL